ncbi:hypothetical protein GCM10022251_33200 [Phytohabitans flavus]|uniref:Uncharacterized protein n=1 Tax=Phytohabitans flavus TaxID=1076124 RepID=A0A6F8XNC2_9ACTN|nr:hypothetical protein Pflav_017350 [Phytohabitans flavus]
MFFFVALAALLVAWPMAAADLGNPLLPYLACLAFLLNITSAVVIRMAKPVAGDRFPVAWRGKLGKTGGFSAGLLLAFMSLMIFLLSFDA